MKIPQYVQDAVEQSEETDVDPESELVSEFYSQFEDVEGLSEGDTMAPDYTRNAFETFMDQDGSYNPENRTQVIDNLAHEPSTASETNLSDIDSPPADEIYTAGILGIYEDGEEFEGADPTEVDRAVIAINQNLDPEAERYMHEGNLTKELALDEVEDDLTGVEFRMAQKAEHLFGTRLLLDNSREANEQNLQDDGVEEFLIKYGDKTDELPGASGGFDIGF